jgi:hypothetical protein
VDTGNLKVKNGRWKKVKQWSLKIFYVFLVIFFTIDFVLFYIATPLLKNYLQNKVSEQTQGLFALDFDKISIELASRRIALKKFELIPDSAVYSSLLKKGENIPALYKISCNSIELWKTSYYQLFTKRKLKAKELKTVDLIIELQQLPDSMPNETASRDFVHQDLFPSISKYLSELSIEEIKVINGKFNLDLNKNKAKKTSHYGYVSIKLMGFRVNSEEHKKREKLFFSENLLINIDEYTINLSDNLHFIYAQDLTISTNDSRLNAKNIGISPRNKNLVFSKDLENNYYKVHAPFIQIENFSLYDLYFNKDIIFGKVSVNKPKFNIFTPKKLISSKHTDFGKSNEIDLTQLIKGNLNSIVVDTFKVIDGILNYHVSTPEENPTYKANSLSLLLQNFRLDAQSHLMESKILYADQIELSLSNFSTVLPDNSHQLEVGQIHASTFDKKIRVNMARMKPLLQTRRIPVSMNISIPTLEISGTNFYELYHKRIFKINSLQLGHSDIGLTIDNLAKPQDEKDNQNNLIHSILSNFVYHLSIYNFGIKESNFEISGFSGDSTKMLFQGQAAFALHKFRINKEIVESPKKSLFFSENFSLKIKNYEQGMKDQIHRLFARTIEIVSADSLLEIEGLKIQKEPTGQDSILALKAKWVYDLNLVQVSVKGLDINKLYSDSSLYARSVSILHPEIVLEKNIHFQNANALQADSLSTAVLPKKNRNLSQLRQGGIKGLLSSYFPIIQIHILNLENANMSVYETDSLSNKDMVAQARFSARFDGFKLTPEDSIHASLLVSDNISFKLSDYFAKLFEKKYQLKIREARFSSRDSVFFASIFRFFPDPNFEESNKAKNLWTFYTSGVSTKGTDIAELMNLNVLNLGTVKIQNPSIISILNSNYNQSFIPVETTKTKIALPLDKIKFGGIQIDEGIIGAFKKSGDKESVMLNAHFSLDAKPFYLDSAALANPEDLIESLNLIAKFHNIRYLVPDSLNALVIKQLKLNTSYKTIEADSLSYFSFAHLLPVARKPGLENVFIPRLVFDNFSFSQILLKKRLFTGNLLINSPEIKLINRPESPESAKTGITLPKLSEKLNKRLNGIVLRTINIDNASLSFSSYDQFDLEQKKYDKISAEISNLIIDSLGSNNNKILNADDIKLKMKDYLYPFPNGFYTLFIKEMGLSTGQKSLFAKGVNLNPNYDRDFFVQNRKRATSVSYLKLGSFTAKDFDLEEFVSKRDIVARQVEISKAQFHSYRNIQYPLDSIPRPPSLLTYVFNYKHKLKIDTVQVLNAYVGHDILGPNAKENGIIDFTRIHAKILNLTNNKQEIQKNKFTTISATGYLMDKSLINARFSFDLNSNDGDYTYEGKLDTFDLREINPLLENLYFVSVTDGLLKSISFKIEANNDYSTGNMRMVYDNLKIDLLSKKKSDSLQTEKRGLYSMVANSVIKNSNPRVKGGFVKEGRIYADRNSYKSVFNFWTLSIVSGMRATLGFKSKQMKDRIKIEQIKEKFFRKTKKQ